MDHLSIIKDLKKKEYAPVYFLHGDEPYFIDEVVNYIEKNVLNEGERSFNQVVLYGKETDFKQVLDQARQFPMMASHRVVIIKEAQSMRSMDELASYFSKPSPQTLLVVAHKYKSIDKRKKKLWSAIKENAVILESKKLYDNKIPPYIVNLAKTQKLSIDNKTAFVIAEHLGNDLSKISNEIDKLALNLEEGTSVTIDHVQEHIGISKDYNIFEFQKSLGQKNKEKAYRIVKYYDQNKKAHPIQMTVGSLYGYFQKLFIAKKYERGDDRTFASKLKVNPFFAGEYKQAARNYTVPQVKRAFKLLHEMDKKSKGIGTRRATDLGIYQEFLYQLFA